MALDEQPEQPTASPAASHADDPDAPQLTLSSPLEMEENGPPSGPELPRIESTPRTVIPLHPDGSPAGGAKRLTDTAREQTPDAAERSPDQQEKARRRQALYLQKRRQKKKRKVFYNRIRMLVRVAMSAVLLCSLYGLYHASFWQFNKSDVNLRGNLLIEPSHLARFIRPYDHKPLFSINPLDIESEIKQAMPLVDQVYVRRQLWPLGLEVAVVEKQAWGILYHDIPLSLRPKTEKAADQDQHPEAALDDTPDKLKGEPAVQKPVDLLHPDNTMTDLAPYTLTPRRLRQLGSPVAIIARSRHLSPHRLERLSQIVGFMNALPGDARLLYVDIRQPSDLIAQFDGFTVRLGTADAGVMKRLTRLASIMPAIRENQDRIAYVDLRWNHQILFKKKAKADSETVPAEVDNGLPPVPGQEPPLPQAVGHGHNSLDATEAQPQPQPERVSPRREARRPIQG